MPNKENMNMAKLHCIFYVHFVEGALQHFFHNESGVVGHYTCTKHQFFPLQRTGMCASNYINIIISYVPIRNIKSHSYSWLASVFIFIFENCWQVFEPRNSDWYGLVSSPAAHAPASPIPSHAAPHFFFLPLPPKSKKKLLSPPPRRRAAATLHPPPP